MTRLSRHACSGSTPQGEDVSNDTVEPLFEYARQARALLLVLQLRLQRVNVHRQPAFGHEVAPDVLVGRDPAVTG